MTLGRHLRRLATSLLYGGRRPGRVLLSLVVFFAYNLVVLDLFVALYLGRFLN